MLYIIVAVFMFGVIIALHEFGHFSTAKLLGVQVNEFSIGMGHALLKKQKGETLYSIRILPIGGYCAMEGQDEGSYNPRALCNVAYWKQIIVMCAGSFMNLLLGFVLLLCLFAPNEAFLRPMINGFTPDMGLEGCGLQPGDVIYSVDGHRIYFYQNFSIYLNRAGEDVDFIVERDGRKVTLPDLHMPLHKVTLEDGRTAYQRGLQIGISDIPASPATVIQYSWYGVLDFVRMVWIGLGDLISGTAGLNEIAGPVGIVNLISQVGSQAPSVWTAISNVVYFAALITVNLGIMNMLPIPALDGGRVLILLINMVASKLFKKKIPSKYEAYIHLAGMALLLGVMLIVTFGDIRRIIGH